MARTISVDFETRRDAELAVEHIIQEHGLDPKAVAIEPVSSENSAGAKRAGSDTEGGRPKTGTDGEPALAGRLRVTVGVEDDLVAAIEKLLNAFRSDSSAASGRRDRTT